MFMLTIPYVRLLALVVTTEVGAGVEVPRDVMQVGRVRGVIQVVVEAEVVAEVVVRVPFLAIPDILRIPRTRTPRTIHIVVLTDMTVLILRDILSTRKLHIVHLLRLAPHVMIETIETIVVR